MKKIISIITICMLPLMGVSAQEKAEKQYLPEEGDWALGIDVVPVLRYVGNAFNGNINNQYIENLGGEPFVNNNKRFNSRNLMPDVSIMGKYMLTDEWAVRANLGLMFRSTYDNRYVKDDKAFLLNPLSNDKVVDKAHQWRNGMSVMVGGEYRKGSKRVQGVFGFGLLFAFQNNKTTYSYGNEMTTINQDPTTTDPNNSTPRVTGSTAFDGVVDANGYRLTKTNGKGSDFYAGVTGSAGIEWFVAPKISLGAEVNLSLYYIFGNQTYTEKEGYNKATGRIETRTDLVSPKYRELYIGTESLGGSLNMTFYF